MKNYLIIIGLISMGLFVSCSNNRDKSDAYGNFESEERLIGSEIQGKIISLEIEEGMPVELGDTLAIIDTSDLILKIDVLKAQKSAIATKLQSSNAQSDVLKQQKENLEIDYKRFKKMFEEKSATQKQLDDLEAGIKVLDKQIKATLVSESSVESEMQTVETQIAQLKESISKCYITSPIKGTLIEKYAEAGEISSTAKNLFKIADLENMFLRVYVSGDQLERVRIDKIVDVFIDMNAKENRKLQGRISWISSSAEFTPKIIQTKEERVNLVYAVKVLVNNPEGKIKIAMPGEIRFKD